MCPKDKHTIIELRSEDGVSLANGTDHETTHIQFNNMDFRGILNDHPEGDKGLWNVQVVYFGLYQSQGMTSTEAIDINIEEFTSPFVLSSRKRTGLTLATAPAITLRDADNSTGEAILPAGFFLRNGEAPIITCRINFTNWRVRLFNQRDAEVMDGNTDGTNLESLTGGSSNAINDWVCRLELTPYHNH